MSLLFAVLLGIIQGLTEFLPVSSTAHLRVIPALLGHPDPGTAFTAVIHLGTVAAILVYFAKDLWKIARATLRRVPDFLRGRMPEGTTAEAHDARLGAYIVLGSIPAGVLGVAFKEDIETTLRSLYIIGTTLIALALLLLLAEYVARHRRTIDELTLTDALIVGVAQAAALIPGVSRSGATLTAALFVGLRREDAARYSFLLSVPTVAGAGVFELRSALRTTAGGGASLAHGGMLMPLVVSTVVSGIVGFACIAWFLRFLRTRTTVPFVAWRVAMGALVLVMLGIGSLKAF